MGSRLLDKVALISGAGRGQGAAEARLFAEEGAALVIGDVLEDEVRQVGGELTQKGSEVRARRLDVTSEEDWAAAVAEAAFRRLDVLVNNAAMVKQGIPDEFKPLLIQATPLGRMGQPEEVAFGALFLACDESSFVTGSELVIDGGHTTQ